MAREIWAPLVVSVVGFAGIYLLLPRPRHTQTLWGALLGAITLLVAALFLIHAVGPLPETVLFAAFGGSALVGGGLLLSQKNPVHAALSFALVVLATCGIFLLSAAPFLMAATIIVYAGAIVVTFLFVIMLAQQAGISEADQRAREPFLASLAGFVLIGGLLCILERTYDDSELQTLMARLDRLTKVSNQEDAKVLLGDPAQVKALSLVEDLVKFHRPENHAEIYNLEPEWRRLDIEALRARAKRIQHLRPATIALDSSVGVVREHKERQLPSTHNVADIGKSLFTDYLVPVELGGTLLLVATVGAIAIAGRRQEGLR